MRNCSLYETSDVLQSYWFVVAYPCIRSPSTTANLSHFTSAYVLWRRSRLLYNVNSFSGASKPAGVGRPLTHINISNWSTQVVYESQWCMCNTKLTLYCVRAPYWWKRIVALSPCVVTPVRIGYFVGSAYVGKCRECACMYCGSRSMWALLHNYTWH